MAHPKSSTDTSRTTLFVQLALAAVSTIVLANSTKAHPLHCADVVGVVFEDLDQNGYRNAGEPGLAGVRLATVKGWLITTDEDGRFHVACAARPESMRGTNFIMKLDKRTLPIDYRLTTENPRVVRLTAGKAMELDFGAAAER